MDDAIRAALARDERIAFALRFGSTAREKATSFSDVDIAVGLSPGARLSHHEKGELVSRLEEATGRAVDLGLLGEVPPGLAYRAFRDGVLLLERDRSARVAAQVRAILEYLDFKPFEESLAAASSKRSAMVDEAIQAAKIAAIADAVRRIREVLPPSPGGLETDRTAREVILLNLFVAVQECISLATHWLADEGFTVPGTFGEVFRTLAEQKVIPASLAGKLAAASGFRNLVAHQYGAIDPARLHSIASHDLEDLLQFCRLLADRVRGA